MRPSSGSGRTTSTAADARRRADELLAAKEFAAARAAYTALLDTGADGKLLEGLALACRALDDVSAARASYEQAYRWYVGTGDLAGAGAVACALADIELSDLGGSAVAAGWLSRARHHYAALPEDPGLVMVEAMCGYRALAYEKDPASARQFVERAAMLAERAGDVTALVMSRAFLGLTQVSLGELEDGFALLDDATAAALAGEVPAPADLDVYCVLITACERVRDLDRMEQWAQRVLSMATAQGSAGFATFARTRYASLLIGRGRWPEAEDELDQVLRDAGGRPLTAAMAMALRATLRRAQGRLDEALVELAACEREPHRRAVRHQVLSVRAGIELDRGDPQAAADLAERYLRAVSRMDLIERIEVLEVLVRARLALGEPEAADVAAGELEATARLIPTDAVRGAAASARALVDRAAGDRTAARAGLERAVELLEDAGYLHARLAAELDLAALLLEDAEVPATRTLAASVHETATRLGARGLATAAQELLRRLRGGLPATDGLTPRETEILRLVAEGLSNTAIAERLVLSPRTVERHVSNIYLKVGATGPAARTVAVAHARRSGLLT